MKVKHSILLIKVSLIGWTYNAINEIELKGVKNKIIVLVGGTSDKSILEYSLAKIFPHLTDIFYFMDFEYANSLKRQGGVDSIVNSIKSFAMSRLDAKFIALFDNDTVGRFSREKVVFDMKTIPDNIKILSYPDLKQFKKYPTISTNGKIVLDNINGRACSIELYLPDKLLLDKTGKLSPIEWESRITSKIGTTTKQSYQGVISNKDSIKKKFVSYKSIPFVSNDWEKMRMLLESFLFVF